MKAVLKILATLVAICIAFFVVAANFSSVPTKYKCTGNMAHNAETKSADVFVLLEDYRWWVGLWSESEGRVHIEPPNRAMPLLFLHVDESATEFGFRKDKSNVTSFGSLSKFSNRLSFHDPYVGDFDGTCKEM